MGTVSASPVVTASAGAAHSLNVAGLTFDLPHAAVSWLAVGLAALLGGACVWAWSARQIHRCRQHLREAEQRLAEQREQPARGHTREPSEALPRPPQLGHVSFDDVLRMGHDLRSPLTSILGYAHMLQSDPELRIQGGKVIERTALRMLELVNDMLEVGRGERLSQGPGHWRQQPLALGRFFQELSDEVRPLVLSGGNAWCMSLAADLPTQVLIDGRMLRRVLVNLLGNAARAVHQGRVVLEVVWLPQASQGIAGRLQLAVRDTGPGLPPLVRQRHFPEHEPAPRTDEAPSAPAAMSPERQAPPPSADDPDAPVAPSAGWGLFNVRQMLQQIGGAIDYRTDPPWGSCFELSVPVALPELPRETLVPDDDRSSRPAVGSGLTQPHRTWLEQHIAMGARTDLLLWLDSRLADGMVCRTEAASLREWIEQGDFASLTRWLNDQNVP